MRYEIVHKSSYQYNASVSSSQHVARLAPRNLPCQSCLQHELWITPVPARRELRWDYFGNGAVSFSIEQPYRELEVVARSLVDVMAPQPFLPLFPSPWESARDEIARALPGQNAWEAREFTCPSPFIGLLPEAAAYAGPSFTAGRPLQEALLDLTARIHRDFSFEPGTTTVSTPLLQVFKERRGVCQDFAQIQIACLRALGLAARYVSGYIETLPPPGQRKLIGSDASHAWVSAYCPTYGWLDLDPTNNLIPSGRHITVAWGRDFTDVSPLRGVFMSSGQQQLKVAVDVNRID
jgi:transglutaminase-like putative cysteine protease